MQTCPPQSHPNTTQNETKPEPAKPSNRAKLLVTKSTPTWAGSCEDPRRIAAINSRLRRQARCHHTVSRSMQTVGVRCDGPREGFYTPTSSCVAEGRKQNFFFSSTRGRKQKFVRFAQCTSAISGPFSVRLPIARLAHMAGMKWSGTTLPPRR